MRGESGTESLMVCLSEYLYFISVYVLNDYDSKFVIRPSFAKRPRLGIGPDRVHFCLFHARRRVGRHSF